MKVGNIVGGLEVVDVKRVNKLNLVQFTKAISEYIDQGYKIDVHSSRQIGLVLQCDVYKLESNVSESVGSTGVSEELEPNSTTVEALQESTENLEVVENFDKVLEDVTDEKHKEEEFYKTEVQRLSELDETVEVAKDALDNLTTPEQNDVAVQKKPRAKKTT